MMLQLYFVPSKFPRTITKQEWKEIWRWKRVTQKQLNIATEKMRDDLTAYGTIMLPAVRQDIINQMINPPIMMHDKQCV